MTDLNHERPTAASRSGVFVLSHTAVGIVAVDDQGAIRSCNPAAEEILGRPAQALLGQRLGFPTTLDHTRPIDLIMPNGTVRTVEMRVSTTTWDGRRLFITAFHEPDVTVDTNEELIQILESMQAELERQSLAVAVTTHELDNSLFAIGLTVDQLRRGDTIDAPGHHSHLVDTIDQRARDMQALIGRLRVASRIDTDAPSADPEHVPVFEFLLERLQALHEDSASVRLFCDPNLVIVAHRGELGQMLDNYLNNALIHGQPPITVEASQQDEWIHLRVRDHGPGVPEQFQPQLFERFTPGPRRTANPGGGTGLGLWITRSLARSAGGDAWYEPNHPHGACFCLRLPQRLPR